jgi:hypothetical protein
MSIPYVLENKNHGDLECLETVNQRGKESEKKERTGMSKPNEVGV